jgi:hypothetical protein
MTVINIRTNRHWRQFHYRDEIPASVLASDFDWTNAAHDEHDDYSDGFISYRGDWFHLAEFERIGDSADLKGWHGIKNFSFSSGVLIRLSDDGETYQIAYYWVTSD